MSEWIKVSDRLPMAEIRVLVYSKEFDAYSDASYGHCILPDGVEICWYTKEGESIFGVTHWMPLPEKPNE